MIEAKHVITMRIPFPTISDDLAVYPHMYVCMRNTNNNKEFIKCQTLKPRHLMKGAPPLRRIIEETNINRNPFRRKTLIDCDKLFSTTDIVISKDLLTKDRTDICNELYSDIGKMISYPGTENYPLNSEELKSLNTKIQRT